ncbi:viral A-type inclusion protein [Clostridium botulinum]|uniref:viral A-type inclusion protein n=1 Tax=unclassified Clostridium TaxID=2614128 RepID=UPI0013C57204|nr:MULTISPECIES: viral A-type inclusion protein [unclassified Clostridium]NFH74493.1 viral A-type inclusion protein [Clostridium botulinum]NFJ73940.1 viral A-type inclusion protein [Clostridium botulinum]NFN78629.1 viral A-type inclusion protein [Clostridium botulinum]NFO79192.1 viral A-type inclusion protein [Clostridium botulinum]NFO89510.1 viral A-type inclusion protein [Clostridium botulinum]
MIQELQTGILDINNKYTVDFSCKQLDDIILKIIVYDKSLPADLSDYNVRLKAFKADQVPLIQNTNISIKDNSVTIKASKQLTTTQGIVKAELQFINKTTLEKKSTFYINIEVIASVLDVEGTVSTPTCTILKEIDHKLDQIENIGEVLDQAKEVRDTLTNTTIPTATNINSKLETNINNASTKITEVESIISSATIKIEEAETSVNNANTCKKELDNSFTVATTNKENLDTANVQAEKNIEALKELGDVTELAKNVQTNTTDITNLKEDVENNTSQLKDIMNSGYFDIAKDAKGADYKTIRDSGLYRNVTGIPTTIGGGILQVIAGQDKWGIAYRWYHIANSVVTEYISCKDGDNFEGWKQLATVDDTGWIDISSTINSKAKGSARVRRISSQVFLEIQWMGVIPENETIATMPSSYAPKGQSEYVFCRFAGGTITLCINGSGTIVMDHTNTGTQNNEVTCFARTSYLID